MNPTTHPEYHADPDAPNREKPWSEMTPDEKDRASLEARRQRLGDEADGDRSQWADVGVEIPAQQKIRFDPASRRARKSKGGSGRTTATARPEPEVTAGPHHRTTTLVRSAEFVPVFAPKVGVDLPGLVADPKLYSALFGLSAIVFEHSEARLPTAICHGGKSTGLVFWPANGPLGSAYCHGGCESIGDAADLVARRDGVSRGEALDLVYELAGIPAPTWIDPLRPTRRYDYRDQHGRTLYYIARFEGPAGKHVQPFVPNEETPAFPHWGLKRHVDLEDRVPYRLPELTTSSMTDMVVFSEGEKCAESLAGLGFTSTCIAFGSNGWKPDCHYERWFAGRRVAVFPDYDVPGRKFARTVTRALVGVADEIRIVDPSAFHDGEDIADFIEQAGDQSRERVDQLVDAATVVFRREENPTT